MSVLTAKPNLPGGDFLWIGVDNLIRLLNLSDISGGDDITPSAVTGATVSAVITDESDDSTVDTISLTHQANGDYEGILPDTDSLTDGQSYTIAFSANGGAGKQYENQMQHVIARTRTV